ncbi:phage tail tape measure protein [Streptomyces sp. NPDC026665]|uniref:phage tail tape measure protein n=1 Tax=Streptomyces sp. NPDC026665 TaxID=3154798 RepID=UPI0033ED0856
MALTVGELNAILSVDDRAVNPALRRAEQALRAAGGTMGDDAERAGQQAGTALGGGFVRGADGQWRNMRAELVDEVTAAALEAERAAHMGGQRAGDALGDGLTDGAADGADDAVDATESRLSRLKTAALGVGAAAGAVLIDAFGQAMEQSQITGRLGAQLGATAPEAQRYGHVAGQMYANAVTEDFQGAADAISVTMRSGLLPTGATEAQIQSISTKVSDLASTFELDLGQAANAAGQMIKTGLAKDGTQALDVMTRGMQVMGPRADDLADTFNEYSTIFRQMGLDAKTTTGLLSQGMKAGARDTDVVADALKEFTLITQGGGKEVDAAFKQIGLSGKEMQAAFVKGGPAARAALDKTFDGLRKMKPGVDRNNVALALFKTKSEDTQKALMALDPSSATDALGKVEGASEKAGNSLRDNAGTRVTQFQRTLQQGLVDFLGTSVIPKLSILFDFVQEHSGVFKVAAAGVLALGAAFAIASIGVWAMNSAMLANPMFWIIAGIAVALVGLVMLVVTYWGQIKSATLTAWSWVVDKVNWAKDGIMAAVGYLAAIPGKVSTWFGQAKDYAVAKLTALIAWLTGLPGRASAAIAGLGAAIVAKANTAWNSFKAASASKAVAFLGWVKGLPGRISSQMGSLSGLLVNKGINVVQGLWNGIKRMGGWIRDKLIGWAKSAIPGPIAKALGINSPSKVTAAQGRWIARGLVEGLTGSSKQVKAASLKLSDIIADSLAPGKRRSRALGKLSAGTKQLLKLAHQEEALAAKSKTATKKLDDLRKARAKLAADVAKGVLDSADITKQDSGGWPQTAETILAGLKQDTAAAQLFAKNLATLRKKGIRSDLVAQIAQAGVDQGSSAAAALANANASQVKQINSQQAALVKAANAAGSTAGDAMYGAGIHAAQGLVKGLASQQKAIESQMMRIAKGMSKSIRAALGIKSPSRVMALVGQYTAQGLIKGVEGQRGAVNASMASLVDTPAPGSWDMASPRARAAAAQKVIVEFRGDSSGETAYLMGKMRRGVTGTAGGDVEFAFSGRRSS